MRAWLTAVLAMCLLFSVANIAFAGEPSVSGQPPVVIATIPSAGDGVVDPKLQAIKIVFSKPMRVDSWSLVMRDKASFPKIAGQVGFQKDRRTFIAPVVLEPGKEYVVWINSSRHQNFRDQKGRPALPYLLNFRTRP
jgi:RNA polymerase sigma-70 factor (ECF subfamily)